MGFDYDDGKGLGEKLRERGFAFYFAAVFVIFFVFLSLLDFSFEYFLPDEEFNLFSYLVWDVPINLGLSALMAWIGWVLKGKPLINRPDTTALNLNRD